MARKVFISVLGTGFYRLCIYGNTNITTRFIQEATLLSIGAAEWSKEDLGIVLLTECARKTNWEVVDNKRVDKVRNVIEDYRGLKQQIASLQLPFTVQDVAIPDGKDEDEMWTIFTVLFNKLIDDDELYIDLTHAFRYLPMLVLVLTNYAKLLKGVSIKSISYGNWEARDGEHAPIVDLMPIIALQDWTSATADYLNNGYASRIRELTETTLRPLMKKEHAINHDLALLRSFTSAVEKISNERITCRGMKIVEGKNVTNLLCAASRIEDVTVAPLKPVIDKIISSVDHDNDTDIKRCIDAARWCNDKNLYQQAITILQEGIVTFFCGRHDIKIDDKDMRGLVNIAFSRKVDDSERSKFALEHIDRLNEIIEDEYFSDRQLIDLFAAITTLRNDYNHCGFRPERQNSKTMKDNVDKFIKAATLIFLSKD